MALSINNCKFNLSTISADSTCIVTNGGLVEIKNSQFRGNKEYPCSGIVILNSNYLIQSCSFQFFKNNGIFCWGE